MTKIDFPSQVPANDPEWLLGANATVPAKAKITVPGRALIAAIDDTTQRAILGLGSAAVHPATDFDPTGAAAAAQAYSIPAYPLVTTTQQGLDVLFASGAGAVLAAQLTSTVLAAEHGDTINALTLNWTYNKPTVLSQSIAPVPGAVAANLRTVALTALGLVTNTTVTLSASDGGPVITATVDVKFKDKRFWGVSPTAVPLSGAFINTLAFNELADNRLQSRQLSGGGQYLYFAWPTSFGAPEFFTDGMKSSGWVKTTLSYTNAHGYTTSYDIYRSAYVQWGADIDVVVA